ncbi:hypothetical protein E1B28_011999 [Marasmius oreades]|uniref:Uncharacterized protein n=1 Tax=Marasmius oreades TaxID=181124 RepID=A0A9P7RRX0_9AGAR|nr:uncharacterized protein E1B28_011999 [Marasmius oreades]KAG7087958.1 hypothetical protein E1B28_011999 [Marasmius oreades]
MARRSAKKGVLFHGFLSTTKPTTPPLHRNLKTAFCLSHVCFCQTFSLGNTGFVLGYLGLSVKQLLPYHLSISTVTNHSAAMYISTYLPDQRNTESFWFRIGRGSGSFDLRVEKEEDIDVFACLDLVEISGNCSVTQRRISVY